MYIRSFHEFIQSLSKKNRKTDTFVILISFFGWFLSIRRQIYGQLSVNLQATRSENQKYLFHFI